MSSLHLHSELSWKKEVRDRFFEKLYELIEKKIIKNEAEAARILQVSSANLTDFKMLRRFVTPKMLFLAQRNLQISASYILCGISQNDSIDHHFHIPSPKKGDQTFRDEPVFTQIEQAYDHREQLWQVPSINPRSFKKTPCIYHEQKLMRYLSSRGDTSFLDPDDYEYLNGDPIEINLVCFSDYFLGLQPGQKLFLSLMSDPFWFWPDPTYYYIITFREDWAVGSIVLSGDIHQLIIHTLNQSDVVLRRNEITSIWRLERWGI